MNEDVPTYSRHEKARIARMARRNIHSECTLILGAGFSVLLVVFFMLAEYTFLPVAFLLGVSPSFVWMCFALVTAAIWSWLHLKWFGPIISNARDVNASILHQYQNDRRVEREGKRRMVKRDGALNDDKERHQSAHIFVTLPKRHDNRRYYA